jgi:hypothetical protein
VPFVLSLGLNILRILLSELIEGIMPEGRINIFA